jgi:hypothetical protein
MRNKKCEHQKRKSRCVECGGSEICEHKRVRSRCKDCKGGSICEHNRIRSSCKDCKGGSICQHNRVRSRCKDCDGSQFCEHKRLKQFCKDCDGSRICIHKNRISRCNECGGSELCKHNIRKTICRECGGSEICKHDKYISRCKECGGSHLCKSEWCETYGNSKYEGYCVACFVNNPENQNKPAMLNYKTKEKEVVDRITQTFTNFDWISDKKVQDGCSRRRPDLLLDMGTHIIIVEVDENKHTDYDCSCEHKRLMELSQDLQHRPIVFIRFNPDSYTNQEGISIKSCWRLTKLGVLQITKTKQKEWEERIETLKQQIQYWIDYPTKKTIEIIELFY